MPIILLAALLSADPSTELDRGRSLAAAGDLKAASQVLIQLATAFPTWGLAQIELAEVQLRKGDDPAALDKTLASARALEPLNPRAWVLSGRFFEGRGDKAKAVEAFTRAVDLRQELIEPHERLGALLADGAQSAVHLKAVVDARPQDRTARANLADALERAGDVAGAEAQLKALVDGAPRNLAYRRRLIAFYERSNQADKAEAETRSLDALNKPARNLRPLK